MGKAKLIYTDQGFQVTTPKGIILPRQLTLQYFADNVELAERGQARCVVTLIKEGVGTNPNIKIKRYTIEIEGEAIEIEYSLSEIGPNYELARLVLVCDVDIKATK